VLVPYPKQAWCHTQNEQRLDHPTYVPENLHDIQIVLHTTQQCVCVCIYAKNRRKIMNCLRLRHVPEKAVLFWPLCLGLVRSPSCALTTVIYTTAATRFAECPLGKGTHALGKSFAECNTQQRGSVEPFYGKACFAECQISGTRQRLCRVSSWHSAKD